MVIRAPVSTYTGSSVSTSPPSMSYSTDRDNSTEIATISQPVGFELNSGKKNKIDKRLQRNDIASTLDSCVSTVLDRPLSLVSKANLWSHTTLLEQCNWHIRNEDSNSNAIEGNETPTSNSAEPVTTSFSSSSRESETSRPGKHSLSSVGQDESGKSNQRQSRRKISSKSNSGSLLTFACHFYKLDRQKYCSFTEERYRNCVHPSIPTIRRIKYDLTSIFP